MGGEPFFEMITNCFHLKGVAAKHKPLSWCLYQLLGCTVLLCLPFGAAAAEEEPETVGNYIYWDDGISLTGPARRIQLKIGGKFNYDIGIIDADKELQAGFPGFDGSHDQLRRFSVSLFGEAFDLFEFRFEIDFANTADVKDNWVRYTKGDILPHFTFGHMKEPFSLEMLTSSNYQLFMESALPTSALAPSRNIGVTVNGVLQENRVTWATGFFLNTGSFKNPGEAKDQLSEANGFDLAGRLTGLAMYRNKGEELLHLGLSYVHRFRNDDLNDPTSQLRTRPESRLTDDRLVDTSQIYSQGQDLVSLEAAWKNGPFLMQGEYYHNVVNSHNSLNFSGWYLQGSWIVSGESRTYRKKGGVFSGIIPNNEVRPGGSGGWGALELALRLSQVDLNDTFIQGGKECNLTAGMNWYLRRKIRLMVNYVHVTVEDRAEPSIENGRADIIMSRLQVNF